MENTNEHKMKRRAEWQADATAQKFGTPFSAWMAASYPAEWREWARGTVYEGVELAERATEAGTTAKGSIDSEAFAQLLLWASSGKIADVQALTDHINEWGDARAEEARREGEKAGYDGRNAEVDALILEKWALEEKLAAAQRPAGGDAVKVPCAGCKGTGEGIVNAYPEAGGCSDCNGKGYDWEPVAEAAAQADGDAADWATRRIVRAGLTTYAPIYMVVKMACDRAAAAPTAVQADDAGSMKAEHIDAIEMLGRHDPAVRAFLTLKRRDGLKWADVLAQMVLHLAEDKKNLASQLIGAARLAAPTAQPTPQHPTGESNGPVLPATERSDAQANSAGPASSGANAQADGGTAEAVAQPTPPDDERALFGQFNREDLESVADGLEAGYEKSVDVGGSPLDGPNLVESSTAFAARFIRAALRQPGALPDAAEDAARLDFMIQHEAWVAWTKDSESCRIFIRDEDGDSRPFLGWSNPNAWHHDVRAAIDAARALAAQQAGEDTR